MTQDSVFAPRYRALSVGALMGITVVAFQALGIGTAMPAIARELGGLHLYGWSFSAFMLASIIGTVAAGRAADAGGPARPYLASVAVFATGSLVGALAGSWGVLLAGRAIQGLGVGALIVVIYVSASRAYPAVMYGRMLALMSTAWVLPSLVGPGLAGLVADHASWRWVFAGLLPLLPVAIALTLPGLRTLDRPVAPGPRRSLGPALVLTAGVGGFLAALELREPLLLIPTAAAGIAVAGLSLRRLLPPGTLRARPGLPAGVAVRGLVAVAFLGADAFMPLALVELRGFSSTGAGAVITAASLSWSMGAFAQARLDKRDGGRGRGGRARLGLAVLLAGLAVGAAGVLVEALPVALAVVGWTIAGFGIGIAYPSVGALVLAQAADGEEGLVSASLQLAETVGVAIFAGIGGALIAVGLDSGWDAVTALALVFAAAAATALAGLSAGRRTGPPAEAGRPA
jgi:MFS family permease